MGELFDAMILLKLIQSHFIDLSCSMSHILEFFPTNIIRFISLLFVSAGEPDGLVFLANVALHNYCSAGPVFCRKKVARPVCIILFFLTVFVPVMMPTL